ncbi:uncharacterized protein LTHEOB_9811 [Neofusicoccum parvum]|nr:uncharacterized protein LTHEOB_9811 [Neofusicoccum parvum]
MAINFSRFTHSPPVRWRGKLRFGPILLPAILLLDIVMLALTAGTLIYSWTSQRGWENEGIYWPDSSDEKAGIVFLYLAVPLIDLLHTLAQLWAYLSTPRRGRGGDPSGRSSRSRLHPAAALSGGLVVFCLWAYQVSIAGILDYVGWEQERTARWYGLAGARAAGGAVAALAWGVYAGFAAAAVHRWRGERARVGEERAREEGRMQGWEEGRREAEAAGVELRGLERGRDSVGNKVSGETMVDVELEEGVRKD